MTTNPSRAYSSRAGLTTRTRSVNGRLLSRARAQLIDGLILNQLLQPATELARENVIDQLERFFAGC